jgi:hypothetical protein
MVYMWVDRGKHACVDLTGVSSLVELRIEAFNVEQTTFKTALSKVGKHEKTCYDNQHVVILFVFDTLSTRDRESSTKSSNGHA